VLSERHIVWELIVHGIAFCIAAAIGAAILYRYYTILEHDTDSASPAREAFFTCVVIAGGVGPAITLTVFWVVRTIRRYRKV
jgi:hypothetical protein